MADGYLARKFNAVSRTGAILDSLGDTVLAVIMTILMLLHVSIPTWGYIWIAEIIVIKLISILTGYLKFQVFTAIHTYANKAVGFLLFVGLPLYIIWKIDMVMVCLIVAATLAAVEELLIIVISKRLERDRKGLWIFTIERKK